MADLHIKTQAELLGEEDACLTRKAAKSLKRYSKNQKLRELGIYTLGGEIFSSITHGVTAAAGVGVLIAGVILAVKSGLGAVAIISVVIYGLCAIAGFTISTVYHALAINSGKRVMRVLDYCSIYFIIAGTYTPFCLIAIAGWVGYTIFGINWILCILGTTLSAINREKFKTFSFVCYLSMGWIVLFAVIPLIRAIGFGAVFWFLLGGGIAYTLGSAVFKMKGKYTHGIWHLFTLAGLVLHFLAVVYLLRL